MFCSITIDQAVPDFTAPATGGDFTLSALRGKKVVLFFYPKDATPGCTRENAAFRDLYADFEKANAVVVGISRDSVASHDRFKSRLDLPFVLVSDASEAVCQLFDVIKPKKMYGREVRGIERSTFLIDAQGMLKQQWRAAKAPPENGDGTHHVDDVLAAVQAL